MKYRPLAQTKQPIPPFKHILLVILDGRNTVNTIYNKLRQTGLPGFAYKQKILHTIQYLEKGGFIVDVSGLKRHRPGKEQPKELTTLGREIAELIYSIDQYYVSFSELTNTIEQNFRLPYIDEAAIERFFEETEMDQQDNTAYRNFLRDKGWSEETINRCADLFFKTLLVRQTFSPESVFSTVIMRYIYMISKSNLDDKANDAVKKDILNKIITNAISEHMSYIFKETGKLKSLVTRSLMRPIDYPMDAVLNSVILQALHQTITTISHGNVTNDYLLNNTIIEKEVIDTFVSIMSISKPNSEFVGIEIENIENFLKQEKISINDDNFKQNKKLQTLLEQYKKTKGK